MENRDLERRVNDAKKLLAEVKQEVGRKIVGQEAMVDGLLMGIIASGHVLVEGVPGLAKTLAVRTLAEALTIDFKRIQFTPDLLPADLTGTMIYRQQTGEFVARKGPVFSNIILADEINRAPAKVQAALLESMAEKQVTIGDNTYKLPNPFFVLATQNPIEQEGTYQLPEAQLDRFVMKLKINYPTAGEELEILKRMGSEKDIAIRSVLNSITIDQLRRAAESITVDERIEKYIVSIVTASRANDQKHLSFARYIEYGASPRATIYLYRCARVKALFEGRTFVLPEDVKGVAYDVLRHRIVLSYEAQAEEMSTDDVIRDILAAVSVP
ncbi:AAA family ATPase [Spirochaeta isovalerica]|uniref:MoxR-like ATPase n=1 Tax=Spirochaeta isovalerica TaxID=150 RepID=A0A841RAL0_9SPIO|nr:AAA family ATPase [Spirochaeta isovalerica]MBB6479472.1 MoxR-like ATPase [Spirochaeta isovalerica]